MTERLSPWLATAIGCAVAVLAGALVTVALNEAVGAERAHDCETICAARQSACREVTSWGPLCHDGSMPGRCE